ncbi:MAG: polysaccharide biosynthesis protein [Firmicutes bacterium]|nr:polysaccharide biosynthesis protein [Bacillota bacterium]
MSENNSKNKSFLGGTVILGIAGLVIKFMGAAFRIPLGNIIGAEGMGYYQKAYPIYNLFLTLAIAGIPTAIARMVAERNAVGRPRDSYKVFRASFYLLLGTGIVTSSLLFFASDWITSSYLNTPNAVYSMKAIAPALLFCPLMAAYRGFFQGRQNMKPTAASQMIEQFARVATGLGLAVMLYPRSVAYAAAGASFGATAGGIAGFIGIALIYLRHKKEIFSEFDSSLMSEGQSTKDILKEIFIIAVPITIGSAVLPIMNAIDMMVVEKRLIAIGYDAVTANSLYGELTGFAQPLINFPQVLTQAVSISMVPLVASAYMRGEKEYMQDSIKLGLRYTLIIAIPCAIGMSVLSKPILMLLYPAQRQSAINAAPCLSILAISVIFLGLTHALTGMLQGVGKQIIPVRNLAIGAVCKVCVTFVLTGIPSLNVKGAACGTLTAYAVAAILDFFSMLKYTGTKPDYRLTVGKPLVSAAVMAVVVKLVYVGISGFMGNALSTLISIMIGGAVYLIVALMIGTITADELEKLPRGRTLAGIVRKINIGSDHKM